MPDDWVVDFPTLGFLAADWVEAHATVSSGEFIGESFVHDGWQLWCTVKFYEVKPGAKLSARGTSNAKQFRYRRALVVGPQKAGKSPWAASIALFEAVGPCLFGGWAVEGDVYRCSENGCGCGFEYRYAAGEPLGMHRRGALIQLLATAEDQVKNVRDPLLWFVKRGHLGEKVIPTEGFIRLPEDGRIEVVTSSAKSRLGNPITFAVADESGIYTGSMTEVWDTMKRGLAGMGGRSLEITNPWDPMANSSAQQTYEMRPDDVFIFYQKPPPELDYTKSTDRRKIHEFVYSGSPWVDITTVEAEAKELLAKDPVQARRFFGNQLVQGLGTFLVEEVFDRQVKAIVTERKRRIALGFDGSQSGDHTAFRAESLDDFCTFTPTYGPSDRLTHWDPKLWPDGRIPIGEVNAALDHLMRTYDVRMLYADPHLFESQIEEWQLRWGAERVQAWPTYSLKRMFNALVRYREDLVNGLLWHEDDAAFKVHAMNARMVAKAGDQFILGKPAEHMKIDLLMCDVLAHEAASDVRRTPVDDKPVKTSNTMFSFA